jgi:acetylornithine deacetylase/succinyl-diaminopimelate desuccinylase-like protein
MLSFDKFKEHAKRILSIQSNAESGNEELSRYLQSVMHDYGFKTQMQQVNHSVERLSKRQCNLIGFTGDNLVDRSSRRGVLFINPLDVTTGNLPQLWTVTQGNPYAPVLTDKGIVGAGAVQGKLDFLCRVFAAFDLLDKRHKQPIYLVGTCASHFGMMGSKFLIESLAVNPKEVFTFAPTNLKQCKQGPGQVSFTIDLESANRDRDSRGYNRSVEITAYGLGVDFARPSDSINAFEMIMELILEASEKEFDFQWAALETKGASGTNPDVARAQIYLTAFQFEDFKQFLRSKLATEEQQRCFRIEHGGIAEVGAQFIPSDLIEVILELNHEWNKFIESLNAEPNQGFDWVESVGALTRIQTKSVGKISATFELRFLPNHTANEVEDIWKKVIKRVSEKHTNFHFSLLKDYLVQGIQSEEGAQSKSTNYLSDAGWFHKGKFPVTIVGAGSTLNLPKGPNETILWSELERAISYYRELMLSLNQL